MKPTSKLFSVALLLLLGTSCTKLETFLAREVDGSEFDKKLAEYYKEFAKSEAEKYDWRSSRRFINKGMTLLNGEEIEPEKLKLWNLPKEHLPELIEARSMLNEILNNEPLLDQKPIAAAKAAYSFDCWVEEQAENWQEEDIKACKDNFYQAMEELKTFQNAPTNSTELSDNPVENSKVTLSETDKEKIHILEEERRIYFSYDSYKLTPEAITKIETLSGEIKRLNNEITEIDLNGYTDRAGPDWYNLQLSRKRALTVKNKMKELGVDEDKMKIFAYGANNPLVNNPHSKKEAKNRRVEIIISDK